MRMQQEARRDDDDVKSEVTNADAKTNLSEKKESAAAARNKTPQLPATPQTVAEQFLEKLEKPKEEKKARSMRPLRPAATVVREEVEIETWADSDNSDVGGDIDDVGGGGSANGGDEWDDFDDFDNNNDNDVGSDDDDVAVGECGVDEVALGANGLPVAADTGYGEILVF